MGSASTDEGGLLLYQAALYDNAELLADLLAGEFVQQIDRCDGRGRTPLHAAAAAGHARCVRLLLDAGADPHVVSAPVDFSRTPLHLAASGGHAPVVGLLLRDADAEPLDPDRQGYCALELAQMASHDVVAAMLLDAVETRRAQAMAFREQLLHCCVNGDARGAERVLDEVPRSKLDQVLNGVSDEDYSALYRASENGHVDVVQLLISRGAKARVQPVTGYSPLFVAATAGHPLVVETLLNHFPELIRARTFEKWTCLHAACNAGNLAVLRRLLFHVYPDYLLETFTDVSGKWVYQSAFDMNAPDDACRTPLYVACMEGFVDVVKLLIDFRVDAVFCGESPERDASLCKPELVLRRASDADNADEPVVGGTPVKRAASRLNTAARDDDDYDERARRKSLRPLVVDVYCGRGRTPLHVAASRGDGEVVRLLVEKGGANVNLPIAITDEELAEMCPEEELHCAGSGALLEACRLGSVPLVDQLFHYGAVDHENRALAVCLKARNEPLAVRLLCRQVFADPDYRVNKKGVDAEVQLGLGRAVVPSALYPGVATMLNWHKAGLVVLRDTWLFQASLHLNPKMRTASQIPSLVLSAITRVDVSNNHLEALPFAILRLPSIRILNASHNKLRAVAVDDHCGSASSTRIRVQPHWNSSLEEIHLSHNALHTLPHELFSRLPALQALDASHNRLANLPHTVWLAPKLKDLNLSHNQLASLPAWSRERSPSDDDGRADSSMGSTDDEGTASADTNSDAAGVAERALGDHVSVVKLQRHNLWQKTVELTKALDDEEEKSSYATDSSSEKSQSALTSLNLSNNRFERVPECLPCVAPFVSRLSMAGNRLAELGPVCNYPSRLKYLDLSSNRIRAWFCCGRTLVDICCHAIKSSAELVTPAGRSQSPTSRRRSRSQASKRSLSVMARGGGGGSCDGATVCAHKRHARLDCLRTLMLAGNRLETIQLYMERAAAQLRGVGGGGGGGGGSSDGSTCSLDKPRTAERVSTDSPLPAAKEAQQMERARLTFPCLTMLDVSNNHLSSLPTQLSYLTSLSVLNLANNSEITTLQPEMGLLTKLWNLNLSGCNLSDPLKSMLESNKYKTMDIIGYLKSVLEDSKPYTRLKLMIVGIQGIGKTSLLEQLRQEGSVSNKRASDGWSKRMGHTHPGQKTSRGANISTVGVDIGDWTYEPKKSKQQPSLGPVTFRTWDFGGQRQYYATHQYFLSRRSLYLVVWKVTDGQAGVDEMQQWLVNIQARAPNAPVIIVGTHLDELLSNSSKFPAAFVDDLQQNIRERFVAVQDSDKKGLPRVVESVVVSCKSRHNIRHLCHLVYSAAHDMRSAASKERLLDQKIPASYLALEEVVGEMAAERAAKGKDPVLSADQYRSQTRQLMQQRFGRTFRDAAELNQATTFLHENGVMLHYEDVTLKDLYFLDPQWLCDILANVITIREINPFAKNGVMRLDDLKLLFKSSRFAPTNIRTYILNLLQKFEVALTWDSRTLLIPSLLPDEYQLRGGYNDKEVKIPVKSKGWSFLHGGDLKPIQQSPSKLLEFLSKSNNMTADSAEAAQSAAAGECSKLPAEDAATVARGKQQPKHMFALSPPGADAAAHGVCVSAESSADRALRRLYLLSYIPSGFWSRLITRVLGDEQIPPLIDGLLTVKALGSSSAAETLRRSLRSHPAEWVLWQTGVEVRAFGQLLFSLKEHLPMAHVRDVDYDALRWSVKQEEGAWKTRDEGDRHAAVEVFLPAAELSVHAAADGGDAPSALQLAVDSSASTKLLAIVVELIDTLLEDWYPSLGTRFVHTAEGKLLVTRLVPCPRCLLSYVDAADRVEGSWTVLSTPVGQRETSIEKASSEEKSDANSGLPNAYSFTVEECILAAHEGVDVCCPTHGAIALADVAPDTVFLDMSREYLISAEHVKRGKMLGRGAFGFVFKASIKAKARVGFIDTLLKAVGLHDSVNQPTDVALKMLQPIDPGFGARQSAATAYKAAWAKWQRDPMQYSCRAYCTARQELNVLSSLHHPNVIALIGVLPRPLALVVELAPLGNLSALLQNYRRSGARLHLSVLNEATAQASRALEYLHQERIIYRDLKAENVLVWKLPPPFSRLSDVLLKLGDYGISRSCFPSGGAKGFGGTEGFMAPEILRFTGEEEYTEKVDCFSFGMLLYELLTLKLPFEGHEQVKEYLLDGGRPQLTPAELLYPCNVLDLMVVAWAQQPADRPSASQIVSTCTAPEFSHLLDAVALNDSEAAVLVGRAFTVDDNGGLADDDSGTSGFEGELWLSRSDGQISILSCNEHGWLDHKSVHVNEDSFVTAMCLVEDTVWLGELTGLVRVFCARTYDELYNFALAPHVLPSERSPRHQLSLPVAEIAWLASARLALVATGQPSALLLCRVVDNIGGQGADPVVASLRAPARQLHCFVALPEQSGKVEIWAGMAGGFVTCFCAHKETLRELACVNHYEPPMEGVDVQRLAASAVDGRFVWSYVYPGSVLYQWARADRSIVARLDCSKIAPCSESISTMNIDERLCPGNCQVTTLQLLDRSDGAQLYVGTTWGVIIVTEADQLRPLAAFRPHLEDVRLILAANAIGRRSPADASPSSRGSAASVARSRSESRKSTTGSSKEKAAAVETRAPAGDTFVLSVGKGYRCLMQRFLDNYREDSCVLDSRNKDSFALMWRTEDWSSA